MKPKFEIGQRVRSTKFPHPDFEIDEIKISRQHGITYGDKYLRWYQESELELIKPKRKVTFYQHFYSQNGDHYCSNWITAKWERFKSPTNRLIHTDIREFEVDHD